MRASCACCATAASGLAIYCETSCAIWGLGPASKAGQASLLKQEDSHSAENDHGADHGEQHDLAEAVPHPLVIGKHLVFGSHVPTPSHRGGAKAFNSGATERQSAGLNNAAAAAGLPSTRVRSPSIFTRPSPTRRSASG